MIVLNVNGETVRVDADPEMPLLWVLRDLLELTGTKYGCGQGRCGSCAVVLDGAVVRSCVTSVNEAEGKRLTTIEGLSPDGQHPVQRAWETLHVPQCGFCQSGQILAAANLLDRDPDPDDTAIDRAMRKILCRCGTYQRIRAAIHLAASRKGDDE